MSSTLAYVPASVTAERAVAILKRDGALVVEDMLSQPLLDRLCRDIEPHIEASPLGRDDFNGPRTRRCGGLMAKSLHTADLLTHALLLGIAEQVLVKEQPYIFWNDQAERRMYPKIQLSVTQAIRILPGQGAQPLHRDDGVHHRRHDAPETQVQVMYAASDFTPDNGCTRVIPGSHLWDPKRSADPADAVPAAMRRGSGLIFLGSVFHGGGPNVSRDDERTGITLSLITGHLRQEENQYLAVPIETVKQYPPEVQALLGWVISPPACGYVDLKDPLFLLRD